MLCPQTDHIDLLGSKLINKTTAKTFPYQEFRLVMNLCLNNSAEAPTVICKTQEEIIDKLESFFIDIFTFQGVFTAIPGERSKYHNITTVSDPSRFYIT